MSTAAIIALQNELEHAEHDLREQKAADAASIGEGERAKQRVAARQRTCDALVEAIAALEKIEQAKRQPVEGDNV